MGSPQGGSGGMGPPQGGSGGMGPPRSGGGLGGVVPPGQTQQAHVLAGGQDVQRLVVEAGRDHHLGEHVGDLPGQRRGHRPVGRDDPAEGRDRIAGVRLGVGVGQVGADGDAARVGVLDDGHARRGEVVGGAARRVGVDVVVVRHGLAVQQLGGRDARPGARTCGPFGYIKSRPLVRVLAVAQDISPPPKDPGHLRPAAVAGDLVRGAGRCEPRRDRKIVRGGARERLGGQAAALVQGEAALGQRGEHVGVPRRVDDHGHRAVVLRRGADHRRAADVDLLHALLRRGTGRDRGLERVEVRHQQLERLDAEPGQLGLVPGIGGVREQARVHPRVQGLHPAVQALGEAGELLDGGDRHPGRADPGRRAAGGDDLNAGRVQPGRQLLQAGLVVDADQSRFRARLIAILVNCRSSPSCRGRTSPRGPSGRPCRRAAPVRSP